jgi:hypothetical protein
MPSHGCSAARALFDTYINSLGAYHDSQDPMLARTQLSGSRHADIRELREQAYHAMLRNQRSYRLHMRDHGCQTWGATVSSHFK